MNKQINFEDNIFILEMRIRIIHDTIILGADPELFLEKTLDDIFFTDDILRTLLENLNVNERFIERSEIFELLFETEMHFSQVIQELLSHEGISIQKIPKIQEKLLFFRNSSLERQNFIKDKISSAGNINSAPMVSSDELGELLKAF